MRSLITFPLLFSACFSWLFNSREDSAKKLQEKEKLKKTGDGSNENKPIPLQRPSGKMWLGSRDLSSLLKEHDPMGHYFGHKYAAKLKISFGDVFNLLDQVVSQLGDERASGFRTTYNRAINVPVLKNDENKFAHLVYIMTALELARERESELLEYDLETGDAVAGKQTAALILVEDLLKNARSDPLAIRWVTRVVYWVGDNEKIKGRGVPVTGLATTMLILHTLADSDDLRLKLSNLGNEKKKKKKKKKKESKKEEDDEGPVTKIFGTKNTEDTETLIDYHLVVKQNEAAMEFRKIVCSVRATPVRIIRKNIERIINWIGSTLESTAKNFAMKSATHTPAKFDQDKDNFCWPRLVWETETVCPKHGTGTVREKNDSGLFPCLGSSEFGRSITVEVTQKKKKKKKGERNKVKKQAEFSVDSRNEHLITTSDPIFIELSDPSPQHPLEKPMPRLQEMVSLKPKNSFFWDSVQAGLGYKPDFQTEGFA